MKTAWFLCIAWRVARALEEESCLVGNDGSCLPVQLPPVVNQYIDVGYGDKQQVTGSGEVMEATMKQMRQMIHYMEGTVMTDPSFDEVKHECNNRNELCVYWVSTKTILAAVSYSLFMLRTD